VPGEIVDVRPADQPRVRDVGAVGWEDHREGTLRRRHNEPPACPYGGGGSLPRVVNLTQRML
jgi:hypothetical protein